MNTTLRTTLRTTIAAVAIGAVTAPVAMAQQAASDDDSIFVKEAYRLDDMQRELDRERAALDRRQRDLDREHEAMMRINRRAGFRFELLDADGNGKVTESEAMAVKTVARQFDALDRNDNGTLSMSEYRDYEGNFGAYRSPGS